MRAASGCRGRGGRQPHPGSVSKPAGPRPSVDERPYCHRPQKHQQRPGLSMFGAAAPIERSRGASGAKGRLAWSPTEGQRARSFNRERAGGCLRAASGCRGRGGRQPHPGSVSKPAGPRPSVDERPYCHRPQKHQQRPGLSMFGAAAPIERSRGASGAKGTPARSLTEGQRARASTASAREAVCERRAAAEAEEVDGRTPAASLSHQGLGREST